MYDVAIIGAGVVGCAIARELSRYKLNVCVIEREEDVCSGTSKANSAIIHAGFDAAPGTLKARLNVRGNAMMDQLSKDLDFPFVRNGSLVVCTKDQDPDGLMELLRKGQENGVPNLRILDRNELLELEPNISDDAVSALYAPTGGIVCPFHMTIALAENAYANGVEFRLNTEVTAIEKTSDGYLLTLEEKPVGADAVAGTEPARSQISARTIVNAVGVYADKLNNMVSFHKLSITARRGEYMLLDKTAGGHVRHTIFQLPGKMGKGVLVTPTVHGNLLVGPTAEDIDNKEGINTTSAGLNYLSVTAGRSVKDIPFRQVITSFAGLRAHEAGNDFVIGEAADAEGFFNAAGIESPGLSSAPAIGELVAQMIADKLGAEKNPDFIQTRKGILRPDTLSTEERNQLIKEHPAYGNIICRCEMITEGEILDAIHRPLGARSLDAVKRRTRAGMGRCQAGFCSPRTMEILEREVPMSIYDITKCGGASAFVTGINKENGEMRSELSHARMRMDIDRRPSCAKHMINHDLVIIGGGPAGLAAAIAARDNGIEDILILERDKELGGILNQCIHNGFGLHTFKEELTGPEYAARFIAQTQERNIPSKCSTMVMDISPDKVITAMNRDDGMFQLQAKAIILAMGCRERSRGALNIPGYRPAGIYSAGTAQRLVNMEGYMPGKRVVILGSGDIGLIMARRMTLEGAKVLAVAELLPYSGGLKRNIVQCLDDFGIPLKLSHTVVDIEGKERVEAVTIAQVDADRKPIPGTEIRYECDTLLLSCGLLPENELSRAAGVELSPVTSGPVVNDSLETSIDGIFACGNVLHVHDLVDYVSQEAAVAGQNAAAYIHHGKTGNAHTVPIQPEGGVRYTVPAYIRPSEMSDTLTVRFRVGNVYRNCAIATYFDDTLINRRKRPVMAPGEMEQVILDKEKIAEFPNLSRVTIRIEEA
jgi:glycerol-3-phosphate dehydrogenase